MTALLNQTKETLLDILFPPVCAGCNSALNADEREKFLCAACLREIPIYDTLFCSVCRARLPENRKICHASAPCLLGAATSYDHPLIKALIWELKYQRHPWTAAALGAALASYLQNLHFDISKFVLVALPLHPKRERGRGFNQSALIAEYLAKAANLPLARRALRRVKETKVQADLRDYKEREENVAGCFAVADPGAVRGRNIIVVDDVFTSGATMNELARVLKDSGARKVVGLVAAKAG